MNKTCLYAIILVGLFVSCKKQGYVTSKTEVNQIDSTSFLMIENAIIDFKTNRTLHGNFFDFKNLNGRYVLIDFWGTWCAPCIKEMPTLKKYHESYKGKLSILGINQGDNKQRIDQFINENQYTWTHLTNGRGISDFVLNFNVSSFPTKIIVDPNGKILHRFVGSGEIAFNILDELLK